MNGDEQREKTALDDVLSALQYVVDASSKSVQEPAKKRAKTSSRDKIEETDASSSAATTLKTLSFCVSIFLEFAFQGEVCVGGKLIKVYSSLRSELQQIMLSAQDTFTANSSDGQKVDAMELAALLTEQFADKPVMSVVGDDEEEACAKRVVAAMNVESERETIVKPLTEFVAKQLHLPLLLHPVPQKTLLELAQLAEKLKTIVDLVAFVQSKLDELLPFSWVGFASDISEVFVCKGHFIESSGQAR